MAKLTVCRDNNPIGKAYTSSVPSHQGHPSKGIGKQINISLEELAEALQGQFDPEEYLLAGLPRTVLDSFTIQAGTLEQSLKRSNFLFKDHQIALIADIDAKWFIKHSVSMPTTPKEVYELLIKINPKLLKYNVKLLISPSSSNGVYHPTYKPTPTYTSYHVYAEIVGLKHVSLEAWGKAHHRACFLNLTPDQLKDLPINHETREPDYPPSSTGVVTLSEGCEVLLRSLFDVSIYQPQRVIFEGTPTFSNGWGYHPDRPAPAIFGENALNLASTYPTLPNGYEQSFPMITAELTSTYRNLPTVKAKREDYFARNPHISHFIKHASLPTSTQLHLSSNTTDHTISISEILLLLLAEKPGAFVYTNDPIEPQAGRTKMRVQWNGQSDISAWSYLHGGRAFSVVIDLPSLIEAAFKPSFQLTIGEFYKRYIKLRSKQPSQKDLVKEQTLIARLWNKHAPESSIRQLSSAMKEAEESVTLYSRAEQQRELGDFIRAHNLDSFIELNDSSGTTYYYRDDYNNLRSYSRQAFESQYAPYSRYIPSLKAAVPLSTAFREWEDKRTANEKVFEPSGETLSSQVNLWTGFDTQLISKDSYRPSPRIHSFLKDVVCSGDETDYNLLLDFLAHLIQRPYEKPTWAVVLVSEEKGTGKSTFQNFVYSLVGPTHSVFLSGENEVTKQFTSVLAQSILVLQEEFAVESKATQNKLKDLITCKTIKHEAKRQDEFHLSSYHRFIFSTNDPSRIPISNGERRYFVLAVDPKHKNDEEYFSALLEEMEANRESFFYELYHRENVHLPYEAPVRPSVFPISLEAAQNTLPFTAALFSLIYSIDPFPFEPSVSFRDTDDVVSTNKLLADPDYLPLKAFEANRAALFPSLPNLPRTITVQAVLARLKTEGFSETFLYESKVLTPVSTLEDRLMNKKKDTRERACFHLTLAFKKEVLSHIIPLREISSFETEEQLDAFVLTKLLKRQSADAVYSNIDFYRTSVKQRFQEKLEAGTAPTVSSLMSEEQV